MIHGLDNLRAPDFAWVLRGRLALPSPPAALVAGPAPPPILHARVQAPRPAKDASLSRLHRYAATCSAELRPRHSRLCYSFARPGFSLHCRRMAKLSKAKPSRFIAQHLVATPLPSIAPACQAIPSLRCAGLFRCVALCSASPSPCIAFQIRRPSGHGLALPSPRTALLRRCPSNHIPASPSPCCAVQSSAFAARTSPSPLQAAALLRRCLAPLSVAVPSPFTARHGRATQCPRMPVPCSSFANRRSALLCRRLSELCGAYPSPI